LRKLIINILFTISILLIQKEIYSQVHQEWTASYHYLNNDDSFRHIKLDNEGNIIVCGGMLANSGNYLIIKYNTNGVQQWIATYNGFANNEDSPKGLAVDDSNNIYVTGVSKGIGTDFDYATVKYNSDGIQQWVARYSGSANGSDRANGIAVDSESNIYVTGQSLIDTNNFGADILTIKYNSDGIQQWIRSYGGTRYRSVDRGNAITCDKSNNVYVTGACNDTINEVSFCTIKYTLSGEQQWVAKYNGEVNRTDEAYYIGTDNNGSVYVSGIVMGTINYDDFATVKYNSEGIQQWAKRYDGSDHFMDRPWGLEVDNLGNVYISGYSTEVGVGYDYITFKYGENGDTIWTRRYNSGLNDIAQAMTIDKPGNIYITGYSDGNGTEDDFMTVKYDSSGNQKWAVRYNYGGQVEDEARAVGVDKIGNVYVAGYSNGDYLTIKYTQTVTGMSAMTFDTPKEFNLYQNYPNPFNPVTNLKFGISDLGFVSLKVYDVLGNEVATLVNEMKSPGRYNYQLSTANYQLSSGIYFYSLLVDGSLVDTKRMILLK